MIKAKIYIQINLSVFKLLIIRKSKDNNYNIYFFKSQNNIKKLLTSKSDPFFNVLFKLID